MVPDPAATQSGYLGAADMLFSSLTSLGGPALKELGSAEDAKPGKCWTSIPALSLPGSQEDECQFPGAPAKAGLKLQGSLHKALVGAGGMPSPRGPSLARVYQCIYCFSLCVCSNLLPCRGLLYLCFPGKISTHKWLNNTTVQALLLLL